MNLNHVLQGLDELFEQHRLSEVEGYLEANLQQAASENDFEAMVSILNEMLGFARETSQYDKCELYAGQVTQLLVNSPYKGSISHATTLLNIANAKRAAGRLPESLQAYEQAEEIYKQQLLANDEQFASLYNNEGLLYEELGQYDIAVDKFQCAIEILKQYEGREYYQAVSYANAANGYVMLGRLDEAQQAADIALEWFNTLHVEDSHKGAALAALGEVFYKKGDWEHALSSYEQAKNCIYRHIGKNAAYKRVESRCLQLRNQYHEKCGITGAGLCKEYYEAYGKKMIEEQFGEYASRIAVGHVGEGSDCFGYDDGLSTDHDFGPGFSLWITKETAQQIGDQLQQAYAGLPDTYKGFRCVRDSRGAERFGVCVIEDFYERVLAGSGIPLKDSDYLTIDDCYLAAAVNGEVYRDDEGIFSTIREKLQRGYPEGVRLLKLAQKMAAYGQNGQYNYERCAKRGEWTAAMLAKGDAVKDAMQALYLLNNVYAPHDKWLHRGVRDISSTFYTWIEQITKIDLSEVEKTVGLFEKMAQYLIRECQNRYIITAEGDFIPDLSVEIARRGQLFLLSEEELQRTTFYLWKKQDAVITNEWSMFLARLTKEVLVQFRYDLEQGNVYPRKRQEMSQQRIQIMDTILNLEKERQNAEYGKHLQRIILSFEDAMLLQFGRMITRS